MTVRESVAVVIPTLSDDPLTLESVPDGVETEIVREGNRAEARNLGVERTTGEVVVFCDDDIRFSESFFDNQVESLSRGTVVGLEDFDFGLLLTRFMAVYRADFERLGGFDERLNHMEDTEFCLNAVSNGFTLESIDRDAVYHEEHESVGQGRWPTLKNILRLCLRYPQYSPLLIGGLL